MVALRRTGAAARHAPLSRLAAGILTVVLLRALGGGIAAPPAPAPTAAARATWLDQLALDGTPAMDQPIELTAPATPDAPTPRPSGEQVLRLAGPVQGPASLDPALARDLSTAFLVRQIFRGLTRLDANLNPVPELAERIVISADGLSYTFTLRQNAIFQRGRAVTADDVVFSLTRALSPVTAGGSLSSLGGPTFLSDIAGADAVMAGTATTLAGATAPDARTVVLRLAAPRAAFLLKLAAVQAAIVDQAQVRAGGDWWRQPNGSGPFQVAEWIPDDRLTLTSFAGYVAGPPPLQRVDVLLGPRAQQPFNLYQAGAIDLATLPTTAVDQVMDPSNPLRSRVTLTPALAVYYVAFSPTAPPTDDPHIRRAIQLAFPRQKVAELTFAGDVAPASGLIPPGVLGRDWPVATPAVDLAAARAEIAASRYRSAANVPTLQIYCSGGGAVTALRDVLERDLGLRVEVISVDWPEFLANLPRGRYPAYAWYWGADYPDPENFLWTLFGTGSADNYLGYRNPAMDALLARARTETDVNRRADLYRQAQDLLLADGVVVPLYNDVTYTIAQPAVQGLEVTAQGILRLDTIWLEH